MHIYVQKRIHIIGHRVRRMRGLRLTGRYLCGETSLAVDVYNNKLHWVWKPLGGRKCFV